MLPTSAKTNNGFEPDALSHQGSEDAIVDFEVVENPNGPEKLRCASPYANNETSGHRRRSSTHIFQLDMENRRQSAVGGDHQLTVRIINEREHT